jgi:hypothetical protein
VNRGSDENRHEEGRNDDEEALSHDVPPWSQPHPTAMIASSFE